jgi:HlyD family secretion protein
MRRVAWLVGSIGMIVLIGAGWLALPGHAGFADASARLGRLIAAWMSDSSPAEDPQPARPARPSLVTALGRLEPPDGVIHVAGPPDVAVVIGQVFVSENDFVRAGQEVARADTFRQRSAIVAMRRAQLEKSRARESRSRALYHERVISEEDRETRDADSKVAEASLQEAEAELELATVRSPIDGQVLKIYAHAGERVGAEGIMTIARTPQMQVVAEIYETDIGRVKLGQRATITSAALPQPLSGRVSKIRPQVAKEQLLHTDPIARTDARVVEVEITLDHPEIVQELSNLQVDVTIKP